MRERDQQSDQQGHGHELPEPHGIAFVERRPLDGMRHRAQRAMLELEGELDGVRISLAPVDGDGARDACDPATPADPGAASMSDAGLAEAAAARTASTSPYG